MRAEECIVEKMLDVVATKWTPVIVLQLRGGTCRYNELKRGLDGISARVLTERLRMLEDLDVVQRVVFAEVPARVEYTLTARGRRFAEILDRIADWCHETAEPQVPVIVRPRAVAATFAP